MKRTERFEVHFSNVEKINPLFSRCTIRVMYPGANRNNSYFSKETIERNLYSIFNIPIVGEYYEEAENFGGHGGEIKIEDGEAKWVHTTKPYGCVPESASVYWEEVTEDDGRVNEYLVVEDALLWTGRYPEVEMLIGQEFGQSMEIEINKGKFKKIDGQTVYEVEDFVFSALCILGISKESDSDGHVEPCFESASIIAYTLNKEEFVKEYKKMLNEIKQFTAQSSSEPANDHVTKGGNSVDKVLKMLESYGLTLEDLQAKGIFINPSNHEDFTLEELEEKVKQVFVKQNEEEGEEQKGEQKGELWDKPAEAQDKFTLTVSQLQEEVMHELKSFGTIIDEYWGIEYLKYSYVDIDTDNYYVIAYDNENMYLVGFDYTVKGDKVTVDQESVRRFKINGYVPMDLGEETEEVQDVFAVIKDKFENAKAKYEEKATQYQATQASLEELKKEHDNLKTEFEKVSTQYANKLKEEREKAENELFEAFSKELTEAEMAEVKANKDNMDLEEIKDKLYALVGKKKAKFNLNTNKQTSIINLNDLESVDQDKKNTGKSYDELFEKFGNK